MLAALRRVASGNSGCSSDGCMMGLRRWAHHAAAQPAPLYSAIAPSVASQELVLPEYGHAPEKDRGYSLPNFGVGGSMQLMAVPRKKVNAVLVCD